MSEATPADGASSSTARFVLRRLAGAVPVVLGVVLLLMLALRVQDPVYSYLGPQASAEEIELKRRQLGLERPFLVQYLDFVSGLVRLDFDEPSWHDPNRSVGQLLRRSVIPTLSITVPALLISTVVSLALGLLAAARRGTAIDRVVLLGTVGAMSLSSLVVVILGQNFGAAQLNAWLSESSGEATVLFAIEGYEPGLGNWLRFCALPALLGAFVAVGYDARYYRSALVEELHRPHVSTARAKGAGPRRVLLVHVLRAALLPLVSRVMITLPFVVVGSIVVESYFNVPGMGRRLLTAMATQDFPVIQAFSAVFAAFFVACNVLTDLLYVWADPRVRLR